MLSSRIELRIEIWNCNDKYQRLVNDEWEVTRVELKTFTRFTFKLVFRLSGRSVPWDKPPASKHTGVHNLHIPVTAYWSVNKWYINISWFRFILQIYFSEWVLIFLKKSLIALFYGSDSTTSRLQSHNEETIYFLPLSYHRW